MITFKNDTNIVLYDDFISQWANAINASCPTEREFCIYFVSLEQLHEKYSYLKEYSHETFEDSPYGCIYDACYENRVNNVIIVNVEILNYLELSQGECMACVLHEVGHLHYYLEYSKVGGNNVSLKELIADCFVRDLGKGEELKTALTKLSQSGLYTKDYCEGAIDWRINRL